MTDPRNQGTVYYETTTIGAYRKVTAIDAFTGQEASVMGPSNTSPESLQQLALNKLRRKLPGQT